MLRLRLALFGIAVIAIGAPHLWRQMKEAFSGEAATPQLSLAKPTPEIPAGETDPHPEFEVIVPGRIVDPHERAVQAAVVEVSLIEGDDTIGRCNQSREGGSGSVIIGRTRTDAAGGFTFTLKENKLYCLRARHKRWGVSDAVVDTGEETEESIQLNFH